MQKAIIYYIIINRLDHRLISILIYVYVRKIPESGSLVVLSMRQYRLLITVSLLGNWTLGYAHTHTHTHTVLLCIYVTSIH